MCLFVISRVSEICKERKAAIKNSKQKSIVADNALKYLPINS